MNENIKNRLDALVAELTAIEAEKHTSSGYTHPPQVWGWKDGKRWIKIDCGSSGAFLMDAGDGELYNISGYGVPDHNKKKKANIGTIFDVKPDILHTKRYNYLR